MRAVILRFGVLVVLVVLGWIAIANAQRDEDPRNPLRADANRSREISTVSNRETATNRPSADPFSQPGRRTAPTADRYSSTPSDNRYAAGPGDSIPDASALGLSSPQGQQDAPRYASASEPVTSGPSLLPGNVPANPVSQTADDRNPNRDPDNRYSSRPADDRYAARTVDRYGRQSGNRYSAPTSAAPTSDAQEPAPFRADPKAAPASVLPARDVSEGGYRPVASSHGMSPSDTEGTGQPGDQRLEGPQTPQLSIQKTAPKEVQVGKPASFRVTVRNTGPVAASEVEVCDVVPRGTKLVSTNPQAKRGTRGELIWALGTIRPNEEATVEMQLLPMAEGEIGSVASVHFGADASVRTVATRPNLVIESTAPKSVMIGEQAVMSITISNTGTGVATGVVLEDRIPAGLQHPAGNELEYDVGELKPGESRKLDLPMIAQRAGSATNMLTARGDGNLRAESRCTMEVVAPQLNVAVDGPKRRYLERQATYQFSVSNPGTAAAKQVELVAALPEGLKFVSANNAGYYEEASRTVRWRLEELPPNESGSVELVTMPVEAGQHALRLRGTAQRGLIAEKEQPVLVEGISAVLFQVADTADPIEVNGETSYDVRVVNQGSKAAGNVRLVVDLPPEVKAVAAEGPTRYGIEGNRVIFEGLANLAPKAETTYRLRVKAVRSGDLRVRFQLMTDEMRTPVTKEESTRVFADE